MNATDIAFGRNPAGTPSKRLVATLALVLVAVFAALLAYWVAAAGGLANVRLDVLGTAVAVGIVAQLVDGALGMAYGVTASSFLLATGATPAAASAAVHVAEAFTTGASGLSHWRLGNIDAKLFRRLLLPGVIGAVAGVLLVTSIDGKALRPFVAAYLLAIGLLILVRGVRPRKRGPLPAGRVAPLGFFGAFIDSVGGGGWGPVVASTLIGAGAEPRRAIGSVNAAEFFVTLASGFSFTLLLGLAHWETMAGLIIGGVIVAPFAAVMTARVNLRLLTILVGSLVCGLSVWNIYSALAS